jgi:hypothetical protein
MSRPSPQHDDVVTDVVCVRAQLVDKKPADMKKPNRIKHGDAANVWNKHTKKKDKEEYTNLDNCDADWRELGNAASRPAERPATTTNGWPSPCEMAESVFHD